MFGLADAGSGSWIDRVAAVIMVGFAIFGGLVAAGVASGPQGPSNPAVPFWGVFAVGLLAAVYGQQRRARWAPALMVILGAAIVLIFLVVAIFSVALAGGDLSGAMLGLPVVGVVNGWVSLGVFAVGIAAGVVIVASGLRPGRWDR